MTVGAEFDGVLPWSLGGNRPFLRRLHGMGTALWRLGEPDAAAVAFGRLLRLDLPTTTSTRRSAWPRSKVGRHGRRWPKWVVAAP